jgi:hypothetical protein
MKSLPDDFWDFVFFFCRLLLLMQPLLLVLVLLLLLLLNDGVLVHLCCLGLVMCVCVCVCITNQSAVWDWCGGRTNW